MKGREKIGVAKSFITLIIPIIPIIKTQKKSLFFKKLFVGLPGFEPGMTGPESVVLPLHHSPIWIVVIFDTAKVEYYFYSAKKIATFFRFYVIFYLLRH